MLCFREKKNDFGFFDHVQLFFYWEKKNKNVNVIFMLYRKKNFCVQKIYIIAI